MIKTLYQIGRAFSDEPEFADYFKPYQNPFTKPEGQTVLEVEVESGKPINIVMTDFRPKRLSDYLFRKPGGSNATFLTPSSLYYHTEKAREQAESLSKFYDRLRRTFAGNKALYEKYLQLEGFWETFKPMFENIVKGNLKEGNALVTFYFDGKAPGEIPAFRDLLFAEAYDKYKQSKKASFVGTNQVCAVTHEPAEEVWGKVDTLGFTVDDEAFIRGGFETSGAWRMFPVSKDVVPVLEGARALVLDRLRFNFFKLNYLIVPRFVGWSDEEIRVATEPLLSEEKNIKTLENQSQAIIKEEERIMEVLEDVPFKKPGVTFDFFFFQQKQAQFSVKLHLTDVMPSRMREISNSKKAVENCYRILVDKEIPAKGKKVAKTIKYPLTFGYLKDYFSDTVNKEVIFHPVFFQILEAVFYRQQLPEDLVLRAFHEKLVTAFKNYDKEAYQFSNHGHQTFAFYQYLTQLSIFHRKPTPLMENQPVALTLEAFLEQPQHADFLKKPALKAAFLAGCLIERLLYVQRVNIKSEPFRKYLHNLQLDAARLQKIMLKWEEKVQEYVRAKYIHEKSAEDWIDIKAQVFPTLLAASDVKKVEFSYAFTMGMVMQQAFTKEAIRVAKAAKAAKSDSNSNVAP